MGDKSKGWHFVSYNWQHTTIYDPNNTPCFIMDLRHWGVTEENQDELSERQDKLAQRVCDLLNKDDAK